MPVLLLLAIFSAALLVATSRELGGRIATLAVV